MKRKSFWQFVWEAFKSTQTFWGGFGSIAVAFVLYLVVPTTTIAFGVAFAGVVVLSALVATFASAAKSIHYAFEQLQATNLEMEQKIHELDRKPYIHARILRVHQSTMQLGKSEVIALLEPAPYFSHNIIASFFYLGNEHEQLIALGHVINIQDDQKIQVQIEYAIEKHLTRVNRLSNNDRDMLENTIVKPIFKDDPRESVKPLS